MLLFSTTGLELGGDSLFLRGGERVVNEEVDEGEKVHRNQVCRRGGVVCRGCFKGARELEGQDKRD